MAESQEETIILLLLTYLLQLKSHIHAAVSFPCISGMQRRQSGLKSGGGRRSGLKNSIFQDKFPRNFDFSGNFTTEFRFLSCNFTKIILSFFRQSSEKFRFFRQFKFFQIFRAKFEIYSYFYAKLFYFSSKVTTFEQSNIRLLR